jgi:L-fucose mutarotase
MIEVRVAVTPSRIINYQSSIINGAAVMLKNVPPIIAPELMKTLMEMGHGDEIVLADGNFPAASVAQRLLRCDGHGVSDLLEAILKFLPLDSYVDRSVALMAVVPGDPVKPTIWEDYRKIVRVSGEKFSEFEFVERFAFYERARRAYAVVATSEKALYANVILKKGVL